MPILSPGSKQFFASILRPSSLDLAYRFHRPESMHWINAQFGKRTLRCLCNMSTQHNTDPSIRPSAGQIHFPPIRQDSLASDPIFKSRGISRTLDSKEACKTTFCAGTNVYYHPSSRSLPRHSHPNEICETTSCPGPHVYDGLSLSVFVTV